MAKQTELIVMVDPPEGWMYGFPRPLPNLTSLDEEIRWFIDSGYPEELINKGMLKHCRYFNVRADKLDDTPNESSPS